MFDDHLFLFFRPAQQIQYVRGLWAATGLHTKNGKRLSNSSSHIIWTFEIYLFYEKSSEFLREIQYTYVVTGAPTCETVGLSLESGRTIPVLRLVQTHIPWETLFSMQVLLANYVSKPSFYYKYKTLKSKNMYLSNLKILGNVSLFPDSETSWQVSGFHYQLLSVQQWQWLSWLE